MNILNDNLSEWYEIVKPILDNPEFQKRKNFNHHGTITVYEHTMRVSILNYKMAKRLHLDYKSAAIAGLLHDFYYKPWMEDHEWKPLFKRHGFTHAKDALENSRKVFPELMNKKIENSILRHMFPLNICPPKYLEGWLLTIADKKVSLECIHQIGFYKDLYFGIKGR